MRAEIRYPMSLYYERDRKQLGERLQQMVAAGEAMSATDRAALLRQQHQLRTEVGKMADAFDGFISMASTGPAPVGLEYTGDRTFLSPWSVVGGPAISLPLLEVGSLPVGLQLMGFQGRDDELIAVSRWLDEHVDR